MKLFGFEFSRTKAPTLNPIDHRSGWWGLIRESFTGAWQQNVEVNHDAVLANFAVFSCLSLISGDVSKLEIRLMEKSGTGVWIESESPAYSPVLRKPNHYQNRIKFIEQWILSKLSYGNTFVLKQRDARGVVTAMYILNPQRVTVLVAPNGDVYYDLKSDDLSHVQSSGLVVPASEMIHDMYCPMYHPLMGVSPIVACGLAATQGLAIQNNSAKFFENMSRPSGILTAPGSISEASANAIKAMWETNYAGANFGRTAVLSDGLTYSAMSTSPADALLVDQLKWSAETVCAVYKVPSYKIGVSDPPTSNNVEALEQQYYTQCLQTLIEGIELLLSEGLSLPTKYSVELDIRALLRMDSSTRFKSWGEALSKGWLTPNEVRAEEGRLPVKGGDTPYLQQQNYPLYALDRPVEPTATPATTTPTTPKPPEDDSPDVEEASLLEYLIDKNLRAEGASC